MTMNRSAEQIVKDTGLPRLDSLLNVAEQRYPGPRRAFGKVHMFLVFMTVGRQPGIGRQRLSESTDLGEGSMRTILKDLRREGYLDSHIQGCRLTETGTRLYGMLAGKLVGPISLKTTSLTVGSCQSAVLVRFPGTPIGIGIEQRDSAVRVGADGATTYIIRGGKFFIPGGSHDCEKDYPGQEWPTLRKALEPSNGDAVVVCGASDETTARLGALAAALSLMTTA